jgi:hypothetical protein
MTNATMIKNILKWTIIVLLAFAWQGAKAQGSMGRNTTGTVHRHVPGARAQHPRGAHSGHKPAAAPANRGTYSPK